MSQWPRFVIQGVRIFGKTCKDAWQEAGARAAQRATQDPETLAVGNISIKESRLILGLENAPPTSEDVLKKYEHLYKVNNPENGGSIYIQAKVTNAKVRLEQAIKKNEPLDD